MRKRWRDFMVHEHSVHLVGLISNQCLYFLPLLHSLSPPQTSFACKAKGGGKTCLGRMALDSGVTMARLLLIQLRSCLWLSFPVCSFQHCITLRSCEWEWLHHLVSDTRMWKTNNGRGWEASIQPVPRCFIPRSGGIWTVGAPQLAFSFSICTRCIQSLLYVKPCWSLHLPCRMPRASNFGPVGSEAWAPPSSLAHGCHVNGLRASCQPPALPALENPSRFFLPVLKKEWKKMFKCVSALLELHHYKFTWFLYFLFLWTGAFYKFVLDYSSKWGCSSASRWHQPTATVPSFAPARAGGGCSEVSFTRPWNVLNQVFLGKEALLHHRLRNGAINTCLSPSSLTV